MITNGWASTTDIVQGELLEDESLHRPDSISNKNDLTRDFELQLPHPEVNNFADDVDLGDIACSGAGSGGERGGEEVKGFLIPCVLIYTYFHAMTAR